MENEKPTNDGTDYGDTTPININKTDIEIGTDSILIVLDNTINKYFTLENFSYFKNEKEVLEYFHRGEDKCLVWINTNFQKQDSLKKFYKTLIYESIKEKYLSIKEIKNIRNDIQSKLEKITKEIKKSQIIDINDLLKIYNKNFNTDKIPKFLNKVHYKLIKQFKYTHDFDSKFYKIFTKKEFLNLNSYYFKYVREEIKPFEFGIGNENFFKIFLLSNYKDICKSSKIKNIFADNYENIVKTFCLDKIKMMPEFESIINNNKFEFFDIETKIQKPMAEFNKMINPDTIFYFISSYFYLILNIMKDTNRNSLNLNFSNKEVQITNKNIFVNINNPYMNKILSNVTNSLTKYSTNAKFNYPSLINSLNSFLIINSKQKEFESYDIKDIENIINNSKIEGLDKNKLNKLKDKMNSIERCDSIPGILLNQFIKYISKNDGSESNNISLYPMTNRVYSNTITIFVSGFLSAKDNFLKSWTKFINYDSRFSNFFFFRWPSYTFLDICFRNLTFLTDIITNMINLPKMFKNSKEKAKYSGKILGQFLASNEIFNNFQINLVGFSLGCHVIKNCLKELSEIEGSKVLINNVVFMGGATTLNSKKWPKIFQNVVGGRIFNCYSKKDDVLKKFFKLCTINNAIGSDKLIIKTENGTFDYVENYDFSDLNLGHLDYRDNFEEILKKIDFY